MAVTRSLKRFLSAERNWSMAPQLRCYASWGWVFPTHRKRGPSRSHLLRMEHATLFRGLSSWRVVFNGRSSGVERFSAPLHNICCEGHHLVWRCQLLKQEPPHVLQSSYSKARDIAYIYSYLVIIARHTTKGKLNRNCTIFVLVGHFHNCRSCLFLSDLFNFFRQHRVVYNCLWAGE